MTQTTQVKQAKSLDLGFVGQSAIVALIGTGLALAGAFGTGAMPLPLRFAYWIGGMVAAGWLLRLIAMPMRRVCDLLGLGTQWSFLLALPLLSAVIISAIAVLAPASGSAMDNHLTVAFLQSLIIGAGIFVLFGGLFALAEYRQRRAAPAEPDAPATPMAMTKTALHEHLPAGFGPILALRVEDHYTIAIGEGRREMLLMPLRDAIGKMDGRPGRQVHRSWWVAQDAVDRARQQGRNVILTLTDGTQVPVSRTHVATVREAGWL